MRTRVAECVSGLWIIGVFGARGAPYGCNHSSMPNPAVRPLAKQAVSR